MKRLLSYKSNIWYADLISTSFSKEKEKEKNKSVMVHINTSCNSN